MLKAFSINDELPDMIFHIGLKTEICKDLFLHPGDLHPSVLAFENYKPEHEICS